MCAPQNTPSVPLTYGLCYTYVHCVTTKSQPGNSN